MNIPLSVCSFLDYNNISFNQLCPSCKSQTKHKIVCPSCNKELSYNEVLSGFKISKGNYIIVDKEQFKNLEFETRILAVLNKDSEPEFITSKFYLLMPKEEMPKPYFLLRNLLIETNKELLVEFSYRKYQLNLGIIKPININGFTYLCLKQILYSDKIKEVEKLEEMALSKEEMELAKKLFEMIEDNLEKKSYFDIKDKRAEILKEILSKKIMPKKEIKTDLIKSLVESIKQLEEKKLGVTKNEIRKRSKGNEK